MLAKALSVQTLKKEVLQSDKKSCRKFGPCGVGQKALYLNSFFIDRMYYVPFTAVKRVFKRVAMSKGGFTGKGMFASVAYFVVVYDDDTEKQCIFKQEEHADQMLAYIGQKHPGLPLISEAAEKRRMQRAAKEKKKQEKVITLQAEQEIMRLLQAREYLEKRPALTGELSRSAKAKRVNERSNPAYHWTALFIVLFGAAAAAYGIWAVIRQAGNGMYFTLFGLAAIFLFAGANVLPTGRNNKKYIEKQWQLAKNAMDLYLRAYPEFPLPARYAHPVTLTRMIRVIREGRAETAQAALEIVKTDLKALNADVQVEQTEYNEIMAIKPMFLAEDYK